LDSHAAGKRRPFRAAGAMGSEITNLSSLGRLPPGVGLPILPSWSSVVGFCGLSRRSGRCWRRPAYSS
jgi:hypothetical protein